MVTNKDYAERAAALGHGIISSCEHGYQGRYIEAFELHQEYNLKFLFASEAYWVWDRKENDNTNCHIFLGARNENGRRAINDVISEANISGFYYQARLDPDLILSLPAKDVIVTSACVAFWRYPEVDDFVEKLRDHFGKNFFLEVQYHNTPSQKELNRRILGLHEKLKIPIIMGCDSHYISSNGAQLRTDFLFSKGIEYPDEEGWFLDYPDGDAAYNRFERQGILTPSQIADAMDNTNVFLDIEEYDCLCFNTDIKCPTLYPDKTQDEKNEIYKSLVWRGWDEYKSSVPEDKWPLYEKEIQKEIDDVVATNTSDYFIDDYHIIKKGIENGGVITPTGRGSGVSYFTNKLLGFTDVDRISAEVKMYPERFMSATRILEAKTLPDLDINVAAQEPFALAQKQILGEDHSYPMIAYGTYKASAAWKLYAKSQGVDFETSNNVSAALKRYEEAVKLADEEDRDLIILEDYIPSEYMKIYERSKEYQGIIDSWSIAPCSYLLYQGSIRREIGLVRIKDHLCCLMDGKWAEKYHFLKNDLLKVKVVDLIDRVYKRIGRRRHTVRELLTECTPDNKVWDIYAKSCTLGVNQVEQRGTSSRVSKFSPRNISELCAFVAAIRPGFKSMYKKFEAREPFSYGIKSLDDLIQTPQFPQSYMLYQEMAMAVLNYAGIPMSECYAIIKNIAKKRVEKVLAYKDEFLEGMEKRLVEAESLYENEAEDIAKSIWQILEDSSRYAFNACVTGDTLIPTKAQWLNPEHKKKMTSVGRMWDTVADPDNAERHGWLGDWKRYHRHGFGLAMSMFKDKRIYPNDIKAVFPAGKQKVYRIVTDNGCWIKCSRNHKFPTPDGEKRLSVLHEGNVLYTAGPPDGSGRITTELSPITRIDELPEQETYDIVMLGPAYNFVNSGGIVACNSHSYCVAIDSLYTAYLKTYYPMEFYECYLKIQEESGDKDKMAEAKAEAEKYFKIKFPPFKFGQDNREIKADKQTRSITYSLSSVKGFGKKLSGVLYEVSKKEYSYFVDVLSELMKYSVYEKKIEPLIKIDYFSAFGNMRELMLILNTFSMFRSNSGMAKQISKKKITGDLMNEVMSHHADGKRKDGKDAASWKITDMEGLLHECEEKIKESAPGDLPRKVKIAAQEEILGYFVPSGREEERPYLYVQDIKVLKRKADGEQFGYSYFCRSVGSGIQNRFTVVNKTVAKCGEVHKGDIILCTKRPQQNHGFFRMEEYQLVQ